MTDPAIPAATLVVFRRRAEDVDAVLMVERSKAMAFAPGAMVFPGGRIDPADRALAATLAPADHDDAAARIAAVRETLEEAGLAVGLDVPADALSGLRAAVRGGAPFGAALAAAGARLALERLVPFARWRPDHAGVRTFDTRFYLADLAGDDPGMVDGTENVRLLWTGARDCLTAADRGEMAVIYPTRRNLERLALFAGFADAAADARPRPVRTITPWIEERGHERWLCIPDDLGYPVTAERVAAAVRG